MKNIFTCFLHIKLKYLQIYNLLKLVYKIHINYFYNTYVLIFTIVSTSIYQFYIIDFQIYK